MAIIKCQNCNNDVSDKAKKCPHCGTTINDENGIENILNNLKVKETTSNNNRRTYNKVATKFNAVVIIMKFLGYGASIIGFFGIIKSLEETGMAFLCLIGGIIATWLSTLIFEAIAEGLQLLQDIKDK